MDGTENDDGTAPRRQAPRSRTASALARARRTKRALSGINDAFAPTAAGSVSSSAPRGLVSVEYVEHISQMDETELDDLPFGAIRVDSAGTVLGYNAFEATLSGMSAESVIGRDFFTEVAPCTNVKAFAGRFREGVEAGQMHVVFPYEFAFPDRRMSVTITLVWRRGAGWIFVNRRGR